MRHFTVAAPLKLKGRRNRGLRGLAGKPFHPPLTDFPIAAYVFAAVFDVLSLVLHGNHKALGTELFHAATWVLIGGAGVSLLAALTGWADWHRSSKPGTQARRTINTHAVIMLTVTTIVLVDLALRVTAFDDDAFSNAGLTALSILAASLVSLGATYGGSLIYDYGMNVETGGDHPAWHQSEIDV